MLVGIAGLVLAIGATLFFSSQQPLSFKPPSPVLGGGEIALLGSRIEPIAVALVIGGCVAVLIFIVMRRRRRATLAQHYTPPKTPVPSAATSSPSASSTPALGVPHVFVSYSHRDSNLVDRLVSEIQNSGARVWIDREADHRGMPRYAAQIVAAIKSCRRVAVMCSRNSFESDHVIREIYVAGDFKKPFVAFELDGSPIPDELLYFLSGYPRLPVKEMDPARIKAEVVRILA